MPNQTRERVCGGDDGRRRAVRRYHASTLTPRLLPVSEQLESAEIDPHGLKPILAMVSVICLAKAEHIEPPTGRTKDWRGSGSAPGV